MNNSLERARLISRLLLNFDKLQAETEDPIKQALTLTVLDLRHALFGGGQVTDRLLNAIMQFASIPLKGDANRIIATIDSDPVITLRHGTYKKENKGAGNKSHYYGAVKIYVKHIKKEDREYKLTAEDIRFVPEMIRDYEPTISIVNTIPPSLRMEWRAYRPGLDEKREVVLVSNDEYPDFSATQPGKSQTVITLFIQNPKKINEQYRAKHPLSKRRKRT